MRFSNGPVSLTNKAGHYFTVLPSGYSGTVTPSLAGSSFFPPQRSYTNVTEDQLKQDFAAGTCTIYGSIGSVETSQVYFEARENGVITYGNGTTASGGVYTMTIPQGVSGTATPLSAYVNFLPSEAAFACGSIAPFPAAPGFGLRNILQGLSPIGAACGLPKQSTFL